MRADEKTIDEYVQGIEAAIPKMAPAECPGLIGDLARLTAQTKLQMDKPHTQTEEPEERLLNIEGIAHYLRVPVYTARQMANTKGFPMLKIGKHIRVELGALQIWARTHLNKEVDLYIYEAYNLDCHDGNNSQENQKRNGTHPSPIRQEAGRRRQYGCTVGAE